MYIREGYFLSLKQDIEMVKEELNSEEKFFEKAVVTERFVKKYKNVMIGSVVAVVLLVTADIAYSINNQNTIDSANATLAELYTDPANKAALSKLETLSPALYDVWSYSQAVANKDVAALEKLKSSKAELVGDLAAYDLAQSSKSSADLEAYASKQDAIYRDLAQVQNAVLLINSGKIDEAHQKLSMISVNSPLAQVSRSLMHYGVK